MLTAAESALVKMALDQMASRLSSTLSLPMDGRATTLVRIAQIKELIMKLHTDKRSDAVQGHYVLTSFVRVVNEAGGAVTDEDQVFLPTNVSYYELAQLYLTACGVLRVDPVTQAFDPIDDEEEDEESIELDAVADSATNDPMPENESFHLVLSAARHAMMGGIKEFKYGSYFISPHGREYQVWREGHGTRYFYGLEAAVQFVFTATWPVQDLAELQKQFGNTEKGKT